MKSLPAFSADPSFAATPVVVDEPRLEDPNELEEYRHSLWMVLGLIVEDEHEGTETQGTKWWLKAWSSVTQAVRQHLPFHRAVPRDTGRERRVSS